MKYTPIHFNFSTFLKKNQNKTELFSLAANLIISAIDETAFTFVCTNIEGFVSNSSQLDLSTLHPCTYEEADTRIFVHVSDIARNGAKRVTITSTDTDVIVIALYAFRYLNLDELWVNFGHGQHQRWYPIHTHTLILGKEQCDALPVWYAPTGCDTVSQFAGRTKKTA